MTDLLATMNPDLRDRKLIADRHVGESTKRQPPISREAPNLKLPTADARNFCGFVDWIFSGAWRFRLRAAEPGSACCCNSPVKLCAGRVDEYLVLDRFSRRRFPRGRHRSGPIQ